MVQEEEEIVIEPNRIYMVSHNDQALSSSMRVLNLFSCFNLKALN